MFLIRSGIPALDGMFHPGRHEPGDPTWERDQFGIFLPGASRTTSICIAGPDGTGKSVLAMHFASRYLADCHQYCRSTRVREPLAFYVSSDLSHGKAEAMWTNFALGAPNTRRVPFKYPQWDKEKAPKWLGGRSYDTHHELRLASYVPEKLEELADYIYSSRMLQSQIAFIDLASHTAGDDWGLIERLLAVLPDGGLHRETTAEVPRHLLLIDAMEGMETFGGDVDAFGQKTTRRGQVAKLMRLASTKCHLILIIEEPRESARMAEQFVADVVLRLRATEEQGYSRRAIEIEKARGQSHVRGRHPYVVRDGRGSTTGELVNFDDPRVEEGNLSQSYLDVYPSLHSMSREIMENRAPGPQQPSNRRAGFGIEELDEMLAKASEPRTGRGHGQDPRGLPCGTVSALIGDANTQKSFLGHAFLAHVFHDLVWQVVSSQQRLDLTSTLDELQWSDYACADDKDRARIHYVKHLCSTFAASRHKPIPLKQLPHRVRRWAYRIENAGRKVAGAAVLVTTKDENNRTLVERFCEQLRQETMRLAQFESRALISHVAATWKDVAFRRALTAYLESRTICRRLEIHDTPSAVLFHVIRRSIEAAEQIVMSDFCDVCLGGPLHPEAFVRAEDGWRIRFVLDDFNSVMRTYGRVRDDPLFLPFLLLNLRREGLSTLIIETQSGKQGVPAVVIGDDMQSDLRALSDHRLYTWHIPDFFGDHRIAIAAIPPMVQQDRKSPVRVRELEWYEPNSLSPPRVNRDFELYDGLEGNKPTFVPLRVHLYSETSAWEAYVAGLNALWTRVFVPPKTGGEQAAVVVGEKAEQYEALRNVCGLYANTNIDHSLIVQVDEFWQPCDVFRPQLDYMTRPIEPARAQNRAREPIQRRLIRQEWFDDVGYGLDRPLDAKSEEFVNLDRIPFVWDFGFLACKEHLWEEATHEGAQAGKSWQKAADVWKLLKQGADYTWRDVLEAAVYVAKWEAARRAKPVAAFDLAMTAPQSFSCLLMEIWFSEIYKNDALAARQLANLMKTRQWGERSNDWTLCSLVRDYEFELYCSWLLLVEALNLNAFPPRKDGFGFRSGRDADADSILTRHWYKSAALLVPTDDKVGSVRFCRLPGAFSVRGDWFLATVRGSRSDRLADRALDLMSSPNANVERLMYGLGLPTRKLNVKKKSLSSRLRGSYNGSKSSVSTSQKPATSTLTYEDVLSLGVKKSKHFHWLWRSNLPDYDAAATIWERWLFRILRRWKSTREYFASDWVNGFKLYDEMTNAYQGTDRMSPYARVVKDVIPEQVVSVEDFPKQCKKLRDELEQLKR